jgi:hypothetical protein
VGVALGDLRPGWLRAVTHLDVTDVTDDDVDAATEAIPRALGAARGRRVDDWVHGAARQPSRRQS